MAKNCEQKHLVSKECFSAHTMRRPPKKSTCYEYFISWELREQNTWIDFWALVTLIWSDIHQAAHISWSMTKYMSSEKFRSIRPRLLLLLWRERSSSLTITRHLPLKLYLDGRLKSRDAASCHTICYLQCVPFVLGPKQWFIFIYY